MIYRYVYCTYQMQTEGLHRVQANSRNPCAVMNPWFCHNESGNIRIDLQGQNKNQQNK